MKLIRNIICILMTVIWGFPFLTARVYEARSDNKFYDCLMKKPLAVAMFYGENKRTCKNSVMKKKYDQLEKLFSTISKQGYYAKGGVSFIKANVKYDSICRLLRSFSVSELPAFILFKNGIELRDKQGKTVMLVGWPTFDQLDNFIRDNLEIDIDRNIKKRAKNLEQLREAERWSYLWYRPYFYGAWPWYGCGPGWRWGGYGGCRRPYWGCGIGFGFGNCCW